MNKTKVKLVIFNSTESFNASLKKDVVTLIVLILAMSFAWLINSSFWSVVILSFYLIVAIGKISDARRIVIKTKNDAIAWAMSLPDDEHNPKVSK